MATITFADQSVWDNNSAIADKYTTRQPGHGGRQHRYTNTTHNGLADLETGTGSTAKTIVSGLFKFDTSYPTGGEDISEIWNLMPKGTVLKVLFDQPDVAAVRYVTVDTGNKKLKGFSTAATEVANAVDLSAVASLRFFAVGY
jgi:hypothetical protein